MLNLSYLQPFTYNFSWVWHLPIPMRIRFLIWKLVWQQLPMKKFLLYRGIIQSSFSDCDLCLGYLENYQHVFIDYVFTKHCWIFLNQNYCCSIPSSLIMLLTILASSFRGVKEKAMLAYMVPLIWQDKIERLFPAKYSQLIDLIQ